MDKNRVFLSIVFLAFITFSLAWGKGDKVVQIVASNIEQNGGVITARGDVLIFSPNYYITAGKIVYDKNNSTMELFDNVSIVQGEQSKSSVSLTNYAFLNLEDEINNATPILLIDKKTNVWINAKKIDKQKNINFLDDATISSCECDDPAWSIGFSHGDYDEKDKWINTYYNTLYVKDFPLWYLVPIYAIYNPAVALEHVAASILLLKSPYFGFSTDNRRRTGLLIPELSYSKRAGYSYAQPIYYAPADNYDFEYIPQVSQKRGKGHELKFRYVDSAYSRLDLSLGIYREYDSYYNSYNILNKEHYGFDIKYDRKKLYSSKDNSDGLYLYYQDMNDVEYLNTKYNQSSTSTNRLLKSELAYYFNTQNYNANIGFEHYNDISKNNNDDVMQVTPSVQLHTYSKKFFNILNSSADIKFKRKNRISGLGANSLDVVIPVSYSKYIFNKYVLLRYTKQLELSGIEYTNNDNAFYENGKLFKNKDIFLAELDVMRSYDSFLHTINFSTSYEIPGTIIKDGDLYGVTSDDTNLSIFPYTDDVRNIDISLNQSIYGKKSLSTWINHKAKQRIIYDENGTSSLDNLENELTLYLPYTSLSNRVLYNHDDDMIIKSSVALKMKKNNLFTNIDYSYLVDKNEVTNSYKDTTASKSITGHIGNKVLKYYTISYKEQHNITDNVSNLKEYSLSIDKRCWKLDLKLSDSLVASSTTTNKAVRQDVLYATITLKPLVSLNREFVFDEREE